MLISQSYHVHIKTNNNISEHSLTVTCSICIMILITLQCVQNMLTLKREGIVVFLKEFSHFLRLNNLSELMCTDV